MRKFDPSRWFGFDLSRGKAVQDDAKIREVFGLSRWFAGIGGADETERAATTSPEADARVRAAIDTLPITMFEFDPNGIYTSVGGRYVGLFGITPAQIVGRSVFDFPRLVPGKSMMVRRALSGESVVFTGIWPLGRYMIRLQPRFDASGRVEAVVGLGLELAKPAAADEQIDELLQALRQSETRFRAMCESAPLGICVCNSRLELGYVNRALCALVDRSPDELLGRQWQAALHPEERQRFRLLRDERAPGATSYDGILRLVRKGGSQVWISLRMAQLRDDGEVLGYVGVITDITQERTARLAIDRGQQDLRRVIESSPEGIAIVRDGCWVFVNRAMIEALGYARPEQLIGRSAGELVHPEDRAQALALTTQPEDGHAGDAAHELRYRKASGEYVLMEIRPALLSEFEGAPATLITARDITERKRLQAQLLVSERLLSVGTLAAGVAHEINNPLAAVLSNLEWVAERIGRLKETQPPAGQPDAASLRNELIRLHQPLNEAREAGERVRAIVHDLKLFSRAEEELAAPVELTKVLDSAGRMAWNEVRHRGRFVRQYGDLPAVEGSEARLAQVFLNLIINAAQAIPDGRADEHEITLSAHVLLPPSHVVVEVRDTGSGIAQDIIGRIFDPFFTTKPPGVGTGLGLAICHRIVTSMGGRIDVQSEVGRGSVFRVTLATSDREVQPARKSTVPPPSVEARGRVLVIDDDRGMGNALGLVLGEDHEVEVFTSARRALTRLREGDRCDVIVCDVMMPEMSGMDFHTELATFQPELASRMIFLTGGAFTVRAREFLDRVENPCLDKPFDTENLRTLVSRRVSRS